MALKLYDTRTRKKRPFRRQDASKPVRMYVCGPTVYDYAHIGNARPVIVFDVLFRLLRHLYGDENAVYVRNITDVDDKINKRAHDEGVNIRELTERTVRQFHEDIAALGVLPPTVEPRATDHIEEMKAMIEGLVAKGYAYAAEGHVLFQVSAMKEYGQLSGRSLEEMEAGARVEVAPYKKDPMDFVLWKPSKKGEPSWPSPCGIAAPGRPGWHIECSAMSAKHLGETFDIHGGGIDLVFPHHENEVAQSRCAHGTAVMANYWMHNGFLQVEGEKMSKSLGNFITVHELLTGWKGYAWPGEAIHFNMLRTHYRQPLDWTFDGLDEAHKTLWNWYGRLDGVKANKDVPSAVLDALRDDLNTPKAITELHKLYRDEDFSGLLAALRWLGFSGKRAGIPRFAAATATASGVAQVSGAGNTANITANAAAGHDDARIEKLITERSEARKSKNFAEADRIRKELAASGIILKDAKDPQTGELVTTWEEAR
jgi:cysteinyl-tRNA synthetase